MKIFLVVFLVTGVFCEFDPTKHENWKLLEHNKCGLSESPRIIGGEEAPMNGYPWIVRIGYKFEGSDTTFKCGGVIANSRTILTAAHCVTNLPFFMKVSVIRLGEHDTTTNPDCEDGYCADKVIDLPPYKIIMHKNYNNPAYKHDIALIKLRHDINFTAFVKPICFPSGELMRKNFVGEMAEVAGWGIYDVEDPRSSTKLLVVSLPVINNNDCKKLIPSRIYLGPTQMCVGGTIGKDSCGGDSGGPLMKVDDANGEPRYYLLGIVSFGSKKCGTSKMPGVYTRMTSYMKWFLNNLGDKPYEAVSKL